MTTDRPPLTTDAILDARVSGALSQGASLLAARLLLGQDEPERAYLAARCPSCPREPADLARYRRELAAMGWLDGDGGSCPSCGGRGLVTGEYGQVARCPDCVPRRREPELMVWRKLATTLCRKDVT